VVVFEQEVEEVFVLELGLLKQVLELMDLNGLDILSEHF